MKRVATTNTRPTSTPRRVSALTRLSSDCEPSGALDSGGAGSSGCDGLANWDKVFLRHGAAARQRNAPSIIGSETPFCQVRRGAIFIFAAANEVIAVVFRGLHRENRPRLLIIVCRLALINSLLYTTYDFRLIIEIWERCTAKAIIAWYFSGGTCRPRRGASHLCWYDRARREEHHTA